MTRRIAMWSGPRNISTAMMRAFDSRPDCTVVDEPFYACYLAASGSDHPMRDEVLASQATNWQTVADDLTRSPVPTALHYQKHMTHHMLPGVDLGWAVELTHCFLIRDPTAVVRSYSRKRSTVTDDDIGIRRQAELYDAISAITGQAIPVVDAGQFLADPEQGVRDLCDKLGIESMPQMLSWAPGRRPTDGVWAPHWYHAVEASTGFAQAGQDGEPLSPALQEVAERNRPWYQALLARV